MYDAVGAGYELSVVAEESATRKADAWIEGNIVNCLLRRERFSSIGGFSDEIIHLDIEGIVAIVVPTDVNVTVGSDRRPPEEMVLLGVKSVIVYPDNLRSDAGGCVYRGKVNAWAPFNFSAGHLIRRKRAVSGVLMNPASRRLCSGIPEAPIYVAQSVVDEAHNRIRRYDPGTAEQRGFPYMDRRNVGEIIEKNVRS